MWLDPERTSPYQFYQFWVKVDDDVVGTYLRRLPLRPLDDLEATDRRPRGGTRNAGPSARSPAS